MARSIASMALVLVWCAAAAESPLQFGVAPADAAWQFEGSRTACRLSHEIPNFGEARFIQQADSYARCVAQLVPASFKQLERSTIAFAPGRATLNDTAKARLDLIAEYVKADRTVSHIFVEGYTDSSGRERKNRILSEQRAKAVTSYLIAAGCGSESIDYRFHGSRFPIASNQTEAGRVQNRRTTVRLERGPAKLAKR